MTGKPGVLQPMGSQRVGHGLATEQQQMLSEIQAFEQQRKTQVKSEDNLQAGRKCLQMMGLTRAQFLK